MSRHACHVTWVLPMLSTRAPRLEARYWVSPSLHLEVTRGCRGERGLEIMSRYCGNNALIRRTHSMMTRGRCWALWWPGGRVTWTRVPGSLQGAAILPGDHHHHTAGGDIITPFISFILRLNIAPLLWYLLSGCRSSRSLPLVNYSDVLFTVHTRAGNEPSRRFRKISLLGRSPC